MSTSRMPAIVGVFHRHEDARTAVRNLKDADFADSDIGVIVRDDRDPQTLSESETEHGSHVGEGAAAGAAAGAGIGALWGLGIVAGLLPAIGPAIAGGALAAVVSSAAAGAAAAGVAGALIGMGVPEEEAKHYESEVHSGRTIVTVDAGTRRDEAIAILKTSGAYNLESGAPHRTVDVPVHRDVPEHRM